MTKFVHNWRILTIGTLCGVLISITFYIVPIEFGPSDDNPNSSPLLWPIAFLLFSFQLVPRLFMARIIGEAMGAPVLVGQAFAYLYWPVIGAIIGLTKHYLIWSISVVLIHVVLTGWILYIFSKAKFTF